MFYTSVISLLMMLATLCPPLQPGETVVTKWQDGKTAAVSLTYDDSTINQFRVAMPLMDERGFPGTFYLVTGAIPGSKYKPAFIGRPVEEIIRESATIPTGPENFFERASAIRFTGYEGPYRYHNEAARAFGDNPQEAYRVIDEGFSRVRSGELEPSNGYMDELYDVLAIEDRDVDLVTWDQLRRYEAKGHEFGSHTILHPFLAVMDSANIYYELERSRRDILRELGPEHTFSAEAPFGTEDERVMHYAHQIFPALRNRMPHPWLTELNRSSDSDPAAATREYVQWQRGPLSDTPMKVMKSWVDTALEEDNIWLVLVFHGVEGIGWEPLSRAEFTEYFNYLDQRHDRLWIATFRDVTKYLRERMNAEITVSQSDARIKVRLTHTLDPELYRLPLTLRTRVPEAWEKVDIRQGDRTETVETVQTDDARYVQYRAVPNGEPVLLAPNRH